MARGVARAPSQNAYRGTIGRTQTTPVHVTLPSGDLVAVQVYTTVDAVTDPELADRLQADDPTRALNIVRVDGGDAIRIAVPVLYHDPAAEVMVLVLAEAQRYRELDERIRFYERLRGEDAPIPAYVKDIAVVFGSRGLREHLERRADQALESARAEAAKDSERRRTDIAAREVELERMRIDYERKSRELERRAIELDVVKAEAASAKAEVAKAAADLEHVRAELARDRAEIERLRSDARNRVIAAVVAQKSESDVTMISSAPPREEETKPITKSGVEEMERQLVPDDERLPRPSGRGSETPYDDQSLPRPSGRGSETPYDDDENFDSDIETGVVDALSIAEVESEGEQMSASGAVELDDETTGSAIIPSGADPLTTETSELSPEGSDGWLDRFLGDQAAQSQTPVFAVADKAVRLALIVGPELARGLGGNLDVRVLLHRTQSAPVVSVVLGPPSALRVPSPRQLATVMLDIGSEHDRGVLVALVKRFEIVVDLVVRGKRVRRVKLAAPLGENVGYILRAAEDHLRAVATEGEPSFAKACALVGGAGFDLLGTQHPEASEFRDDKLAQLQTAQQLRRAIAMARRFARPSREDYLVCTRSFPLPRWRELRRHVLECAVAWGMWMGPELAQVAVSEGLARSRRDLVAKLDRGFEALRKHETAFDLDDDAAEDNAKAIAEEARALGVELQRSSSGAKNGAIASDEVSSVSGSIGGITPARGIVRPRSVEELIAQLADRQHRVAAALELCDRAESKAAAQVIGAVTKMSRAEAVRVLGMSVKFGDAAKAPLLEGLASSKAFLRHGCALALALLRTEDGTQAVIDLLLTEPTEIWREVARAIGQVGPTALLPLASTYGRLGAEASPGVAERVAWAMAHVAVRGGKAAIETMAGGQSVVAPVARQALELHASAANDQVRVRPGADGSQPGRDVTVNRAFSRRFFEAVEAGIPDAGQAGLVDLEASGPMEMLDEADLIDDEEESELDESDLIRT